MIKILLCLNSFFMVLFSVAQNVGIGTTAPNSSAVLDVASNNKGLLLPRVADTSNIVSPAGGLVMYNQATQSPNYYDGAKWNDVADARNNFVPLYGNITYSITGTTTVGGMSVDAGPLAAIDYNNVSILSASAGGGGGIGVVRGMDTIIVYKEFDANSIILKRAHLAGQVLQVIEIFHSLPNSNSPFYSVKLTNVTVYTQSFFISEKTGKLTEKYGLQCQIVGYKDWVNNKSFSYNNVTRVFGTY